jgi:hypothetical protein
LRLRNNFGIVVDKPYAGIFETPDEFASFYLGLNLILEIVECGESIISM